MIKQKHFWFSLLLLSGCMPVTRLGQATLVVRPELERQTLTTISPYTQADIEHLTLKLFTPSEQDLGISKTLLNADLGRNVAFANLKVNTTYRVRAFAYASAGTSQCISNDANSYVDIAVGTDDRPTLTAIPVKLINKDFNGQATGTIQVTGGGYQDAGAANMDFISPFGIVTTLAGNGATGSVDGSGTSATFNGPYGVAVDSSGNVFVGDRGGNRIRKITPTGIATTYAGRGNQGYSEGNGTNASFFDPSGLVFDKAGNLYVADRGNHCIRKITPTGDVSTFAGNGTQGQVDGTGTAASFNGLYAVAIDQSDNLYVSDTANNRIRKVTPSRVVSTLAGNGSGALADGTGSAASFYYPKGITLDPAGNIYVADYSNNRIRRITANGVVTTLTTVSIPQGIARDILGNLYFSSTDGCIRKLTLAGDTVLVAGNVASNFVDGIGNAARFNNPCGLAIDSHGYLYVADYANNSIRKVQ